MLDPYVRLPLKHNGQGTFSVQFKVGKKADHFKLRSNLGYGCVSTLPGQSAERRNV